MRVHVSGGTINLLKYPHCRRPSLTMGGNSPPTLCIAESSLPSKTSLCSWYTDSPITSVYGVAIDGYCKFRCYFPSILSFYLCYLYRLPESYDYR